MISMVFSDSMKPIILLFCLSSAFAQAQWLPQTSNTAEVLLGVSFPSKDTGFAVGTLGLILATTNSGDTWVPRSSGTK